MLLIGLAYPSENSYIYKTVLQAEPKNGNSSTLISVKMKKKKKHLYVFKHGKLLCLRRGKGETERKGSKENER